MNEQVKIIDDYLFFGDFVPVKLDDIGSNAFYVPRHFARGEGLNQFRAYTLRINNDGSASIDIRFPNTSANMAPSYVDKNVSFPHCKL